MTRKAIWTNADGLKVGFGPNYADYTSAGVEKRLGSVEEAVLEIKGEKFSAGDYQFDEPLAIPEGAVPEACVIEVMQAFVLGGTTPTIRVGTTGTGAEAVWGSLAEASAEALGTYLNTVVATPLTATTKGNIKVSLGGTSPTVTAAGHAKIRIRYRRVD